VADLLGPRQLLERKPSQLSGGQQQRVALGRAIIAEAPVCLMDEPLSNLDAQLRGEMRREIRALQQRLGITMVYVTHDQTEAMTMADRVVLLRDGRIEQVGSPEELYARPRTAFTASFIGAPPMNLLKLNGAARSRACAPRTCASRRRARARVESVSTWAPTRSSPRAARQPSWCACPAPARARRRHVHARVGPQHEHRFRRTTGGRNMKKAWRLSPRHSPQRARRSRRPRSRSTTRSPSAARSPRSSTRWPPTSRRRTPASR
jgi:sn-glycerol 3-phosphate transport system ATP-binding protein